MKTELTRELTIQIDLVYAAISANQDIRPYLTDLVTLILETAKIEAHEASEDRLQGHLIASHDERAAEDE